MNTAAVFTVFVVIHLLHQTQSENSLLFRKSIDVPDYYWRDYRGVIPFDAVSGGTDRSGSTTYIGQSLVLPYGILVGSIYYGNASVPGTANGQTFYSTKNVKILCSGSPEKFKWISTNKDNVSLITYCHLVWSGSDRGYQLNIGRVNYNEEVVIGKVLTTYPPWDGLWIPDKGSEKQFIQYEILAFDCKPHT